MCDARNTEMKNLSGAKTVPVTGAVGMMLAHDITEIRKDEFKGRAFKKGHIVKEEDISHLQRLGKENLYVLQMKDSEIHEDDAAHMLADALMGVGVKGSGEPKEGKINIIAEIDGLLKIDKQALSEFNALGEVMCATLHNNSVVKKGQLVAGTRAIPLVVSKAMIEKAVAIAGENNKIIEIKELRKPKVGVVITGNEVYTGKIQDAFAPVIRQKIQDFGGEIIKIHYAPDDEKFIEEKLRELIAEGADTLITTGGMSVDPDDVTRFAIRNLGVSEMHYGSAVLPGAMFLIAYLDILDAGYQMPDFESFPSSIPILGIPACGMYHRTTIFDLVFPRVLAGERIGRRELAEMGHGGLCLDCKECRYPLCHFGK